MTQAFLVRSPTTAPFKPDNGNILFGVHVAKVRCFFGPERPAIFLHVHDKLMYSFMALAGFLASEIR